MASISQRLVFDPTDTDSRLASANVGAYVRAGTDGDLIGSETLNSLEWLRVTGPIIDSAGNEVNVTSGALDVNLTGDSAGGLHDEDSAHSSGDKGNMPLGIRVDDLTAIPAGALAGTELDYQALISDTSGALFTASKLLDGSANPISSTGGSLHVDVQTIVIDSEYDEDTAHTSGDKGQFGLVIRVDDLTAVPATALAGTELDYQGLIGDSDGALFTASKTLDGSGNAIGSTSGSLDVNITNTSAIDIDDDLADTAIENTATAVSTIAVNVVTAALANRKWLWLANEGNKSTYWGKTGVTTINGFPLHPGMQHVARVGASVAPQIIGGTGASSEDLRVMELS